VYIFCVFIYTALVVDHPCLDFKDRKITAYTLRNKHVHKNTSLEAILMDVEIIIEFYCGIFWNFFQCSILNKIQ